VSLNVLDIYYHTSPLWLVKTRITDLQTKPRWSVWLYMRGPVNLLLTVNNQIQRKEVEPHLQSATRLHLAFTCSTFKETTEKLDALQKEVKELKASNCVLVAKVDAYKEEWTAANSALASKLDAQNRKLATTNSALSSQIDANKREWKAANIALNLKCDSQTKEISRLTNESPFLWKITGFSDVLRLAKNRSTTSMYGEFYSGKQGYKFKVRVDPDGDQTNKNRYLSLYVGIMKGDYDAILTWPFRKKVTFSVIDQQPDATQRKNIVAVMAPEQPTSFSGRPTTEENPKLRGFPRLISHKVLKTRRYVEHDTLFLQVEVGSHDAESSDASSDLDSD